MNNNAVVFEHVFIKKQCLDSGKLIKLIIINYEMQFKFIPKLGTSKF